MACCWLALATLSGCYTDEGSGELVLETYPVEGFAEVVFYGNGQTTIVPGEYRVAASADSDVLPTLRVERRGDVLLLGRNVDWIDGVRPTVPIDYRISMPMLSAARTSGSGSITVRGVPSERLELAIAGAGIIDVAPLAAKEIIVDVDGSGVVSISAVDAGSLRVKIAGSGRVAADGRVDSMAVEMLGSGVLRASRLQAGTANIEVTGAGQALVWPADRLLAQVTGTGRIAYLGEPVVEQVVQGEGQVVAAQ